ncbi:MAG: 2-oxoglutarate dehydrogenase complex dihydrolipoyllysine-residue succinyltransferase [Gammaproteobacteria bacterium]
MSIEIKVPPLPESVADATVVNWRKKTGESVLRDENLVDLETDKVVLEVPAPTSGTLREIRQADGATVTAGSVLAILEEGAGSNAAVHAGQSPAPKVPSQSPAPAQPSTAKETPRVAASHPGKTPPLAPAARRLIDEHGLDPDMIEGHGREGRISKGDVLAHLEHGEGAGPAARPEISRSPSAGTSRIRRVPMTRIRARIAERLRESNLNAVMLTSFNEVDLTRVIEMRASLRERFEKTHGIKLGFMSFFVKAAVLALKRFPVVNASIEGSDIVYHDFWDMGIAVSSKRGLVVPIVREADQLSFAEIETRIAHFAEKARSGGLELSDLEGGTFTITNGGVFGSLVSTPIINPPQSAILGMHKIQDRPMALAGQVVIRPMMYLALTYDHRLVDGQEAVQFLVVVKESLEDPDRLLLDL